MNALPSVRPGDVVDVVAPASACSREHLALGVATLEAWGLAPRVPDDLFGPPDIFAHRDEVRWRHLARALTAPDSKLVWCARGGYGSLRLLPRLEGLPRPARRKLLVGYSDVTVLQGFLAERWKWVALHAPTLGQLGGGDLPRTCVDELRKVLFGRCTELVFPNLRRLGRAGPGSGVVEGRLAGGNLRSVQSTLGTPWQLPAGPLVLFFEDTGERGYAIDRMLEQLRHAGVFRRTRALLLGDFTGGRERDGRFTGNRVLARFAESVRFPVLAGLPVGHGRRFRPLPLGMRARIDLAGKPRLSVDWKAR